MRKIESSIDRERKQARNQRFITIFFLIILLLSSAGYAFISYSDNSSQTPIETTTPDGRWQTTISDKLIYFSTSPSSTLSVPVDIQNTIQTYSSSQIYIVADSEAIINEFSSTLGQFIRVAPACLGPCEKNLPEKTCSDNVVFWNQSDFNRVYQVDNCIYLEGDIRSVDAFLFKILGIQ